MSSRFSRSVLILFAVITLVLGFQAGTITAQRRGGPQAAVESAGHIHSSLVGAVAVASSNPDIVYIGTGESEIRGNIIEGDGAYKSTDGGKSWTHIGLVE